MGNAGRPRKYDTPEKAAAAEKELSKKRGKKRNEKIKTNPKAKAIAQENKARYEAKIPQEKKRKTWRIGKQAQRGRERMLKEMQIQVSCEQAEQLEFKITPTGAKGEYNMENVNKKKAPAVSETAEGNVKKNSSSIDTIISQNDGNVKHLSQEIENNFYCNIDTKAYKDKETAKAKKENGGIVNRTKNKDRIKQVTAKQLANAVCNGYSFTTACLSGTKEEHFLRQYLAVLDIDNENKDVPITTIEDAEKILTEHGIKYSFMYYSFSHSTSLPKFRIVCVLEESITDPAEAKRLNQYLISLFPQADKSCFNLDRFYYGTCNGLATEVHDRVTTINVPGDFKSHEYEPQPDPEPKQDAPIGEDGEQTPFEKEPPKDKSEDSRKSETGAFNLGQAIRSFNLLEYVEQTTGTQGVRHGKDVLFNPCPLCGHHDHFYIDTERNLYKCHSKRNGTGGNIINYIMQKFNFDKKQAREYFIYDLMKQDRKAKRDETSGQMIDKYLTVNGLQTFMRNNGISIKYNVISRIADIEGLEGTYSREHLQNTLPLILTENINNSYLCEKRTNKDIVSDFLSITLAQNDRQYNPVLEMLSGAAWDGIDRIPEIFSILRIDPSDRLSQTLLYKWYWQGLSMLRNNLRDAYGADGALVLQGAQGIGKTSFVLKMAVRQEFCSIGKSLNFQDKDTLRRCASSWLIELGEIETTFKSDKEKLKAFITDPTDLYRLPYGKTDVHLARRTSLIGTCNSTEYLIDETGNRRFWTIPLIAIDLDALNRFDALQLWLQIDSLTKHNRQGFRLSKDEQAQLAERNGRHEKPLKGELEVRDIFAMLSTNNRLVEREVTVTEFKTAHEALKSYSVQQISQVLNKMGVEILREQKGNKDIKLRKLPMLALDFETRR